MRRLQARVREAYAAGHLGEDILGTGVGLDLVIHAGAGAYICGEETALLDSLEGRRGQPRLRPPFPAVEGLYACPTVINNVETIASVPSNRHRGHRLVRVDGHREVQGLHDLLPVRTREGARPVRGAAGRHPARAARPRRRHARRTPSSSSGRRAARRRRSSPPSTSTSRSTTKPSARPGRCSAPRRCKSSTRPRRSCVRAALDGVLQARVVRQVHAVPRGHVVARADPAPAGCGRGSRVTSSCCSTCATTSSAAPSARSATAQPARSRRDQVLPRRVRGRDAHAVEGAVPAGRSTVFAGGGRRLMTSRRALTEVDRRARHPDDRRRRGQRPQGHARHPRRRADRRRIPRFCDHPLLEPVGACRQCLVEVTDAGNGRGFPKPQASCTLEVAPAWSSRRR